MHNLDRILSQQETFNELANETNAFGQSNQEYQGEYQNEYQGEYQQEYAGEMNEAELAAELLTVNNEAEMEQFLGKLFSSVVKGVSTFAKSNAGKALGGVLKQVAKTALPSVGAALGSLIPIPGVGTALGSMAGKALASRMEMEAGNMAMEDREFETAQQVVRLASNATRAVINNPGASGNPQVAAAQAVKSALNDMQAPTQAVLGGLGTAMRPLRGNSGRWFRRGNTIVLQGA